MKTPMRATKKPVTIEFIEWTGKNLFEVITFSTPPTQVDRDNLAADMKTYIG